MDPTLNIEDPKSTALILIDLQQGIVARQLAPHSSADVIKNSVRIADALRAKGGAIVFVHVLIAETLQLPADEPSPRPASLPPNASDLVPELNIQPTDVIIAKRQWGAFYSTNLDQQLRRRNIRTIILGGIATNMGVESTARAAHDQGYQLIFAEDTMSTMSPEFHAFPIKNIFPRMGRVRTTEQILAALP